DLRQAGYQTAIVGKWHLGHGPGSDPAGFDHWRVLPGQGDYHDPELLGPDGPERHSGYVTDIITDLSLDWLRQRDPERPFLMMINHKAPHRPWEPDARHAELYADVDIPEPETFDDDHAGRAAALADLRMSMADLNETDLKQPVPDGLTPEQERSWRYQRYIKDYLRCVASIDDNVGRVLDWVEAEGLTDDTVISYTSDQGFFLGDHGWYDKRLMYEESLRMPLLVSYPPLVRPGSTCADLVTNIDFAPTLLELAGVPLPERLQGHSLIDSLSGRPPAEPQRCVYYRYWEHLSEPHHVPAHFGVRTERYKLICYLVPSPGGTGYTASEFELYDLDQDRAELVNRYHDPEYAPVVQDLLQQLRQRQLEVDDRDLVAQLP
ncbi:MAG TPA: sulfatase/phosphatase domain-containing protein, partial [Microlunatus sp.]|nr:sulfatase/phosphatase domain-containing protein [Microlunatus sp.]